MADPQLATRAPETDALEDIITPGDPRAQVGASVGEHCITDRPLSGRRQSGDLSTLGEVDVYISKPPSYPQSPARLLLLLTGGTGVRSVNNQIQADKYASHGYVVVMPDLFAGDPAPNSTTAPAESHPSLIEQIKLHVGTTAKSFMIDMWLARHTAEKVLPIIHGIADSVKDEYADAVAHGGGIYAVGYCFGAKYVILMAGEHADAATSGQQGLRDEEAGMVSKGPFIKAGAIAHGTQVTGADLAAIKSPLCLVCVENDQLFPADVLAAGRKRLQENAIEHEIQTYPGVPHGFAVVGEYDDPRIREAQAAAFDQMLRWLQAH